MVTPTLRHRRVSRTTARTELGLFPFSLRVAHCKLIRPTLSVIDIFFGTARSVTVVGGTTNVPEVAAEFSGGGFSNVVRFSLFRSGCVKTTLTRSWFKFPRPEWQEAAVGMFLKSLPNGTYAGLFNPQGRVRELYCLLIVKENSRPLCFALMHNDHLGDPRRLGTSG